MISKLDVFTSDKLEDRVYFPKEKVGIAKKWLSQLSLIKGTLCILWDSDTDGGMSGKITLKEIQNNYPNINIINYMHNTKVHGLNNLAIQYILENNCGLVICVDCGSSDYPYIEQLTSKDINVLILDHHLIESLAEYESNEKVCLVNSQLLETEYKEMSGAMVCLQFLTQVTNDLKLFDELMESAVLTIVSDICETKYINVKFLNNYLYGKYKINELFRAIQGSNKLTRDFLISLSTKFNSYIRYKGPREFMKLLCESEEEIIKTNFKSIKEMDTQTICKLMAEVKTYEFDRIVVCIFDNDDEFFEKHLVRNYLGIIANKLANEKKKLALVMMPTIFDYENDKEDAVFTYSVRDYINRESITHFRELGMDAHGHHNAFGGTIPRTFSYYTLADIDRMVGTLKRVEPDTVVEVDDVSEYVKLNSEIINYMGLNNSILKDRIVLRGMLKGYLKNKTYFKEIISGDIVYKTFRSNINLYSKVKVIPTFNGSDITLIVEQEVD